MENKRCYELNEEEINKIREEVGKYTTEADLVRPPRFHGLGLHMRAYPPSAAALC